MTEDKATSITETKKMHAFRELTEEQLDCISGGQKHHHPSDFDFVDPMLKATPILF